ncbi:MAG: hypothetical protein GWO24_13165 [Akkermansiaceae bacterium]|nr:hypothetical protein [Akkermansiaceae bacterium]
MEFLQFEGREVGPGGENPATASAEIDSEKNLFFHEISLRKRGAGASALLFPAGDD